MAVSGLISGRSFKLHKTCQSSIKTKNVFVFGAIFRHVALLVTEISRQDQNFRIIPRIVRHAPWIGGDTQVNIKIDLA